MTWLLLDARGQLEQADYALYVSIGLGVYLLWLMLTTPLPRRHR